MSEKNDAWWETPEKTIFSIGGEEISIIKRGAEYASQFGRLTGWLGTYGLTGLLMAYEAGIISPGVSDTEIFTRLLTFMMNEGLTPEAVVELSAILLGKDREFAEEHFDPGWLIDGLFIVYDKQPGIKVAFSRLWDRFRVALGPDTGVEEDQAQD